MGKEKSPDVTSFEGRYPKHLFNKSVYANDGKTFIGYVAKETHDLIVVFSDSDSTSRFDIPKSKIVLEGNSVIIEAETVDSLEIYKVSRDQALPQSESDFRGSEEGLEEAVHSVEKPKLEEFEKDTRADALIEGARLQRIEQERQIKQVSETGSRLSEVKSKIKSEAVGTVSRISNLNLKSEAIVRNVRQSADEFRTMFSGATKIAEVKVKQVKKEAQEKKEEKDREKILKMEDFASKFTSSFDEVISEINTTRTYEEQERIYNGFSKLLEQQRKLVIARRDLASKLKGSVQEPVYIDTSSTKTLTKPEADFQVPSVPSFEDRFPNTSIRDQEVPKPKVKRSRRSGKRRKKNKSSVQLSS